MGALDRLAHSFIAIKFLWLQRGIQTSAGLTDAAPYAPASDWKQLAAGLSLRVNS